MILDVGRIIEKLLKVELKEADKNGEKIVPFKLNRSQKELDATSKPGAKHVVLKARQLGISTYIVARFLIKCLVVPGTHAVIISHEKQATIKLLRKAKFFIDMLRQDGIAVNTDYDSKYEMTFPDTNSSLYIGTAGQKAFARGDTITDVHGSEVAFWENAEELMRGIIGTLTPNAEVFLESTANGAGGYFYNICQKAIEGKSEWRFHFYPWTDEPLYQTKLPQTIPLWTKEELELHDKGLSWPRLYWRRKKVNDYDSLDEFLAEYPLTAEEAFVVTGACYFDKPTLRLYNTLARPPQNIGTVEMVGAAARFNRFEAKAPISFWEHPRAGMEYLISCDASEGIDDEQSDFTVAQVLNRGTLKQAAVLCDKMDPLDAASLLYALGAYYGWPWLAVESNGPGLAVLLKLQELGYPRLYRQKRLDLEAQQLADKLGWQTSAQTRTPMLSSFRGMLKRQLIHVLDTRLLRECTTFCRQRDGHFAANSGCHDDHVMSMAIAAYLHEHIPMDRTVEDRHAGHGNDRQAPQNFSHGSSGKTGY